MSIELKPCPFCGATQHDKRGVAEFDHQDSFTPWIVWCWNCGIQTKDCKTLDEAAASWNRRTTNNEGEQ